MKTKIEKTLFGGLYYRLREYNLKYWVNYDNAFGFDILRGDGCKVFVTFIFVENVEDVGIDLDCIEKGVYEFPSEEPVFRLDVKLNLLKDKRSKYERKDHYFALLKTVLDNIIKVLEYDFEMSEYSYIRNFDFIGRKTIKELLRLGMLKGLAMHFRNGINIPDTNAN
jgi:hypothetical protein